ncbi:bifunctional proline dehydrogenase/L-glutamate gamma-semialdehyde dehydrogenase PutA [Kordiimonas pumila]|uniref:Bifunctional protein PutA n=1 Tax=Kordiimonas pumila TaxID=2161677 RepID=A0ABV7D7Z8_9PROT|nr:bifunctional proline dehydrogenase/L-glutamate gamma-semialdehyde dehydrogenase PutA [Kordiimonas pumila]
MLTKETCRTHIKDAYLRDETTAIADLTAMASLSASERQHIVSVGAGLVKTVRASTKPGVMESFLAEYGLSTTEGVALMCLAEALLRVPDSQSIDDLINDKIAGGKWNDHLGHSDSGLVNLSSYSLNIISGLLDDDGDDVKATLRSLVRKIGMPAVRTGARLFMKELGRQFVLGQNIDEAKARAAQNVRYRYSYDMLGEAAKTAEDAEAFYKSYMNAIKRLALDCDKAPGKLKDNPGISIKLSALHPRYEWTQRKRVLQELAPKVLALAVAAKEANMGLTIDAEEANRLELSLDVITNVFSSPDLAGWDGFGIVIQAYGKRAPFVIDYLYALATEFDRKIMIRLVKGAYWDAEIKLAQVMGLEDFPVYTRKAHSDISYAACTRKLYTLTDRIFPQFATHNAHTVATVLEIFAGAQKDVYEFQRLHGMGESLYKVLLDQKDVACRVYAPVGVHRDLLAYLVRRLLENGANSSFVNQLYDAALLPEDVVADPVERAKAPARQSIALPADIFGTDRANSKGWDVMDGCQMQQLESQRAAYRCCSTWNAVPVLAAAVAEADRQSIDIINPADTKDVVGRVCLASVADVETALDAATETFSVWQGTSAESRAAILHKAADLFEDNTAEIFALLCREAGKSLPDAVAELREAVDFLRYYAEEAKKLDSKMKARGVIVCISPWNFPLAIFTGQIAAALAVGNTVIAKPAEQTPLIAARAVELLLEAGIPAGVLQLVPGAGDVVGAALVADSRIAGVCFTGSTGTAQIINRTLANASDRVVPLVAETGGLNAMIVDSTALPEQAVRDIVASAFQSAGQRCSALRILYVQEDVKDRILTMLYGAMDELVIGNPWDTATDIGPVIDSEAHSGITAYVKAARDTGRLLKQVQVPTSGLFVPPTVVSVSGIEDMEREIFGPVLHVATYKAKNLGQVVTTINQKGYGLTLGVHSRIDDRIDYIKHRAKVGNIYINRNQIGAVVGSQPFGGEGLSGTGPKAGGPHYLNVFVHAGTEAVAIKTVQKPDMLALSDLLPTVATLATPTEAQCNNAFDILAEGFPESVAALKPVFEILQQDYPAENVMVGPVGESNQLYRAPKGLVLCLGPDQTSLLQQLLQAVYFGNKALVLTPDSKLAVALKALEDKLGFGVLAGAIKPALLTSAGFIDAVAYAGAGESAKAIQKALAHREGAIMPLIDRAVMPYRFICERHICTDTTASGGNVTLLAAG